MLERYARRVAAFVTFEDHVKMGGFGTAVVEALDEMGLAVPVVRIGWPDQFIEHGKVDAAPREVRPQCGGGLRPGAAAAGWPPPRHIGGKLTHIDQYESIVILSDKNRMSS